MKDANPVLIVTISNGAGHVRAAEGIAAAIQARDPRTPVLIADIADYMTLLGRFTHIRAYLWLVKHAPAVWDRIDRYQKKQTRTSPEWFYRRECHKLFEVAGQVRPRAIVATEVGCGEIAALIKRDLKLDVPLVAASNEPDVDRAWVQPEVDLYCFPLDRCEVELVQHGAPLERIRIWGPPLASGFELPRDRNQEREWVCSWLALDPKKPLLLVAGGSEGIGLIEETTSRLLGLERAPQVVVLSGRNQRLRARCQKLGDGPDGERLRVLSWTWPEHMPRLMVAADLMISKLGSMFYEAIATSLPIVALVPPPGSERLHYQLLEEWQIGRAVRTVDELSVTVAELLSDSQNLTAMREQAGRRRRVDAAVRIARWLEQATNPLKCPDEAVLAPTANAHASLYQEVSC